MADGRPGRRGKDAGDLAREEQVELQNYVRAGHLSTLIHSTASRSLKARKGS
jgi:hypothetical protein